MSLLAARKLSTHFPIRGGVFKKAVGSVRAVHEVSLEIQTGEIVGLVGESGCGKSTLGFSLLGLTPPTSGEILLMGSSIDIHKSSSWKPFRRDFQIVFQDPYTSLNPRLTVFELLAEPLATHGLVKRSELREAASDLLRRVGLSTDALDRFPHAFSGGQRQRIAIARALILRPQILVLDEPTSALDVSIQKQVLALLSQLQKKYNLAYLMISHDLAVIRAMSHEVMVLKEGRVVEFGDTETMIKHPRQVYTKELFAAAELT